jgi:type IV pilus assembly protein PilW
MRTGRDKQTGFSLIELMIAITLSLVLTIGIIQIFSSSKQTSRVQDALARVQENARFALDILSHDIRMAGQLGCNSGAHLTVAGEFKNYDSSIYGYEYADLPADSALIINNSRPERSDIVEDTDTIIVRSAATRTIPLTDESAPITNDSITAKSAGAIDNIAPGDPMVISDCVNADMLFVKTKDGSRLTFDPPESSDPLANKYQSDAEVMKLNYAAYYIRVDDKTGNKNLYRSYVNGISGSPGVNAPEPLLENVENLQIFYGENVNGNIRYVRADQVGNMSNVVSVRIHLLLSTGEDNLAIDPQSYWYVNQDSDDIELQTAADGDKRLFRSFTTTIQLRNYGIGV